MSGFTTKKPAFDLTVRDFFVLFAADQHAKTTELLLQMPVVKSIRVQPGEQTKPIYASGAVYDTVTQLSDSKLGLTVVALPRDFVERALGTAGTGSVRYDVTRPHKEEFACGYWCENSDGSATYYYHPRCKLVQSDEETKTSEQGQQPDPSVSYEVMLLPTDEDIWRVRYSTAMVAEGKAPLTPAAFFELRPDTVEKILAIPGSETSASA